MYHLKLPINAHVSCITEILTELYTTYWRVQLLNSEKNWLFACSFIRRKKYCLNEQSSNGLMCHPFDETQLTHNMPIFMFNIPESYSGTLRLSLRQRS